MDTKYHGASSQDEREDDGDAFELLEQLKKGSVQNDWNTTSRLPPKSLSPRSTTRIVRTLFWTGFGVIIIIVGCSVLAALLPIFLPDTSFSELGAFVSCDLAIHQGSNLQSVFTINLRGQTRLSFTEAKAIDVIWQLVVGGGGRFMMAWISYKVFMDGLTRLTEQWPIPYNLYTSLTFSTTSLFSVWYSLKAVYSLKGWRIKCFLLWFALSTIYVLGFPTLMSATAGYLTPSTFGFNMSDAGALIGLSNGTVVAGPPASVFDVNGNEDYGMASGVYAGEIPDLSEYPLFASLLNNTMNHTRPVYDKNDTAGYTTDPSYLGSGPEYALPWGTGEVIQNFTSNVTILGKLYQFHNYQFLAEHAYSKSYCYNNQTIPSLEDVAECLPESYFVWGLSSLMVYVNISLFLVWLFGMYFVWLDARIYSALCRSGRRVRGHLRTVADLSEAMREVLGDETCAYSDADLARELSKQPGLRYYAADPQDGEVSHIGLSSFKRSRVPYNSARLYGKAEKDR